MRGTICLVEAGNYRLGIDTSVITRKLDRDSFAGEECREDISLLHLQSFLDQQLPAPSQSALHGVEVKTGADDRLMLLVDGIGAEIDSPDSFESIPLLYPELAGRCCPQIMIHDNEPVLFLDTEALQAVRTASADGFGVISWKTLQNDAVGEVRTAPLAECSEGLVPEQSTDMLDEETFRKIVTWTIGEYLARGSSSNAVIRTSELPREYRHSLQRRGVDETLLQRLVDKTLQKCRETDDVSLQQFVKKSGGLQA